MTQNPTFKFALGDIVVLDPTGQEKRPRGKIIGRTHYIDGSISYVVSTIFGGEIMRQHISEHEIHKETDK